MMWSPERTLARLRDAGMVGPISPGFIREVARDFAFAEAVREIAKDPEKLARFTADCRQIVGGRA